MLFLEQMLYVEALPRYQVLPKSSLIMPSNNGPSHRCLADEIAQTYDENAITSLVSTLSELLALNPNADVLIAATIRNEDTFAYFVMVCGTSLQLYAKFSNAK